MKVRAIKSFASAEATLSPGQEAEMSDGVVKDLVACGYVELLEERPAKRRTVKKNEGK